MVAFGRRQTHPGIYQPIVNQCRIAPSSTSNSPSHSSPGERPGFAEDDDAVLAGDVSLHMILGGKESANDSWMGKLLAPIGIFGGSNALLP